MNNAIPRAQWASRLGFILAAAGSAVGLGNIWKFPYVTGQNGGGAFVLVYLGCILVVGLPIMMAELMIGRHTRRAAVGAFMALEKRKSPWILVGWVSTLSAFVILSYYAVVAGWTLDYVYLAVVGSFNGQSPDTIEGLFGSLINDGLRQTVWLFIFLALCLGIVFGGVQKGIERWSKILMPILFVLLLLLFGNAMLSDGAAAGLRFMFRPDFGKLTPGAILEAMGHAFYTLSLGMAAMITYGSYLRRDEDLFGASVKIASLDTTIALVAGLAIFPVVFAVGMEPAAGPGLVFKTLPVTFSRLPGGYVLGILFFLLLAFAALTSAVSLLEAQVAYLIDEKGWGRKKATTVLTCIIFLVGIPSALSYNVLGDFKMLGDRSFFDALDLIASNYLLPIAGLFTAIYVGWFWRGSEEKKELVAGGSGWIYPVWHFLIRYVTPLAVGAVLYFKIEESGLFAWFSTLF
ncbi:MAG: sodium-dependent transporter [Desulfuromonadales bacterium]|nr:sodium-dependent transporter [Desulfuromonadales bacterium]